MIQTRNKFYIRLEAFTATELDKIFSGYKLCQLWIKAQRFRDHLRLHHQGNNAEMVSETLGFCPQLTRLVAQDYFIKSILIFLCITDT
jgi:hypothetical protein